MRTLPLLLGSLGVVLGIVVAPAALLAAPAAAPGWPAAGAMHFTVMRDGEPIGASTVRLSRRGDETIADVSTHIEVKIAFFTVYRFDQRETERWEDGHLLAMTSLTRDNGSTHRVTATRNGDRLLVDSDGRTRAVDPNLLPYNPWNAAVLKSRVALNTKDGSVTPVAVTDRGEERVVLHGRTVMAHHYSIRTSFPQDVWYDRQQRLVQVELHGSDGSTIRYQLG
jgi:Domain of unknown function (DUF6134)